MTTPKAISEGVVVFLGHLPQHTKAQPHAESGSYSLHLLKLAKCLDRPHYRPMGNKLFSFHQPIPSTRSNPARAYMSGGSQAYFA